MVTSNYLYNLLPYVVFAAIPVALLLFILRLYKLGRSATSQVGISRPPRWFREAESSELKSNADLITNPGLKSLPGNVFHKREE